MKSGFLSGIYAQDTTPEADVVITSKRGITGKRIFRMAQETHYDAFISYRHSPLDIKIATALHRKLENYTLPRSIARKIGKRKLERVFRDTTELSVSAELSAEINQALINSDFLIVICSPRFSESVWCMQEVETFLKLNRRDQILLVLIEGEPKDSFPEILCYEDVVKKDINGDEVTVRENKMPLAADCKGKNSRELRNAINDTTLRLCSAIFGIKYDDLKQRQREVQFKKRVLAVSAVILVLLLIISQSSYFLFRLHNQNRIIEKQLADSKASSSMSLLREGRTMDAIYAARSVLPTEESEDYNDNAFRALTDATGVYTFPGKYRSDRILSFPAPVSNVLFSGDGRTMIGMDYKENSVYVLDTADSSLIDTHKGLSFETHNISFNADNWILYADEDKITCFNREDRTERELIPKSGYLYSSADFSITLAASGEMLYGISGGEILYEKEFVSMVPDETISYDYRSDIMKVEKLSGIFLSNDGKYAAALFQDFSFDNGNSCLILCFDAFTGNVLYVNTYDSYIESVYFDGKFLFLMETEYGQYLTQSVLNKINTRTDKVEYSVTFEGESFYGFYPCEGYYMLYNTSRVVLLDEYLDIRNSFGIGETGVNPFTCEGAPGVFLMNGKMYLWSEELLFFYEANDFGGNGSSNLKCYYNNGIIYILKFTSDFVTVYEKYQSRYLKEYSGIVDDGLLGENDSGEESSLNRTEHKITSEDGKFTAVQNIDWKVSIYDADTEECVFDTYSIEEDILHFYYVESDNVYVLSDYLGISIFTADFKFISRIDDVGIYGKNPQNGHLILNNVDGDYELTVATYDEVIQIADEMLGEYRPDEKIQEKYALN